MMNQNQRIRPFDGVGFDEYLEAQVPMWESLPNMIDKMEMIDRTRVMVNSLLAHTGEELFPGASGMDDEELAKSAFEGNFFLLSHGEDHVLNYGNRWVRALWRFPWNEFTQTPSEMTTPSSLRADREKVIDVEHAKLTDELLRECPISERLFFIGPPVTIWQLRDRHGSGVGLAAKFDRCRYLT